MNGKARVWVLICLLLVALIGVISVPALVLYRSRQPALYVGRTRLLVDSAQVPLKAGVPKLTAEDVLHTATSNAVIERSIHTLEQLGVSVEPIRLIQSLKVEPVEKTHMIQIEVTSPDPDEAKSAADVVAAETMRRCRELFVDPASNKEWRGFPTVDHAYVYPYKPPLVPASLQRMLPILSYGGGGFILGVCVAWVSLRRVRRATDA